MIIPQLCNDSLVFIKNPHECRTHSHIITQKVSQFGFALIRGLFLREEIRSKIPIIKNTLSNMQLLSSSGVSAESIRKNNAKWSIGSDSASQSGISRLMITIMNPMHDQDFLGLHDIFKKLIICRDELANRDSILFDEVLPKPKFNGTRLQIYPGGGGFMTKHIDHRAINNVADISSQYIQLLLLLTEKGLDYHHGGAFVEKDSKIIDSETGSMSGDVLVYDANTLHGVADIDSNLVFDPLNNLGRIVALASIYN